MAKFPGNVNPKDMRSRDVVAVIALALSGFLPEILLLAIVLIWISSRWNIRDKVLSTVIPLGSFIAEVAVSDNDTSRTIAWIALIAGVGFAGYLMSRADESQPAPAS